MDSMQGKTLSHFRILSPLGEGGMGVVYLAEDLKLGRRVALKVLPPEKVGDEERRLRFLREARTAAAISHPHIAAVYEIDEADGVIFIAMELVEGQTLRALLEAGVPPLKKSLRMAAEMAEALAGAHEAGIVHRDLKPENVMVRPDGHVKILDFGLAKLREDASGTPEATRMETVSAEMTREGKILGTAAYMSPEQARGRPVDARSDLFSFGIVLYEMATGRSPFQGPSVTDTLSAIVRDQPAAMSQVAPGVPEELVRIVSKCLEKDVEERYQHTDDLAMDLRKLRRVTDSQTMTRVSDVTVAVGGRAPWKRPVPVLIAVLALMAVVFGLPRFLRSGGSLPGSGRGGTALAVLTFENLQDAEDPQRLGQILQELVITDLSELESVTVFSSQRLFDLYKQIGGGDGRHIDRTKATEVATKAGASTMLTGTLSRLGTNWILTGQLVEVGSGEVIQSERIDGADLYKMVDELTGKIRRDLRLSREDRAGTDLAVNEKTTSSLEAYQHYLEGTELLSAWKFEEAVKEFKDALAIDPRFGLARFKQAIAAWWALGGRLPESDETSPSAILHDLLDGDFKLSDKDRTLARGMLAVVEDRYDDADPILTKLVQDYPDEKEAWYGLGEARYHRAGGDRHAAYAAFEKALELDPTFQLAFRHLRESYYAERRYREGIEKVQDLLRYDPDDPTYYSEWMRLLCYDGDPAAADGVLERALGRITEPGPRRMFLFDVAYIYRDLGDERRREEILRQALAVETDEHTDTVVAELGWHFLTVSDYRQAEENFLEALEQNPQGGGARTGLFRVYDEERRYADGILRARALVQKDPTHLAVYEPWIDMAVHKGDAKEIERSFRAAEEHAGTDTARERLLLWVAEDYADVGDRTREAEYLEQASELDTEGDGWSIVLRKGRNAMALGDYEEAERLFRSIAEHDDASETRAFASLVDVYLELGRPADALHYATGHVAVHWNEVAALADVVRVHLVAGDAARADEAVKAGFEALEVFASRRRMFATFAARAYLDVGQPARAEELIRGARERDPDLPLSGWTQVNLAAALRRQARYDEAEQVLREGLEVEPRNHGLLRELALLDLDRGDLVAAERRVRNVLSDGPVTESLQHLLAQVLAEQGRYADARPYAQRAFSMQADRSNHTLLAWVLVAGDLDLDEGMRLAEAARKLNGSWREAAWQAPYKPSPEHALGLAYLKKGQRARAVELLEKAASLRPDRTLIQEHLAEARRLP